MQQRCAHTSSHTHAPIVDLFKFVGLWSHLTPQPGKPVGGPGKPVGGPGKTSRGPGHYPPKEMRVGAHVQFGPLKENSLAKKWPWPKIQGAVF